MNKQNLFSILSFIIICIVIYNQFTELYQFSIISPDSIRFMRFWQINFDLYNNNLLKIIYHSLKDSTQYDLNRGRYLQYIFYGFEVIIHRYTLSNVNYLMIIVMILNNILIGAYLVKKSNKSENSVFIFLFIFLILSTNQYFFSSIIVLVLYGKYLWVTFILSYFISKRLPFKIMFLILAAFTDEIGLISAILIIIINIFKNANIIYFLLGTKKLFNILIFSVFVFFGLIFIFYGISAVLFNVGSGLLGISMTFGTESIYFPLWSKLLSFFYNITTTLLGSSSILKVKIFALIAIIIVVSFIIITLKFYIKKEFINFSINQDTFLSFFKSHDSMIFWAVLLVLVNLIILPGGMDDIGHRGYPRFITISIFVYLLFLNVFNNKYIYILFTFILSSHLGLFTFNKNIRKEYSNTLSNILFIDTTVTWKDINSINKSVIEFKKYGESSTFSKINNNEEIDYSGTWYYSRIKNYDTTKNMYFPIKGTIRTLAWPIVLK